uniref:Uncharacterized protein n=1 Tax=Ditylenchus dipsaci TaxID=166011 RepID=A0A915CQX7_9BILA
MKMPKNCLNSRSTWTLSKGLSQALKMVQQCTIQNPNKTAQRRRTNSIAVLMIDSPPSNRTDFNTKRQRALSQVDEDIKRKKERNPIVPSLLMKNLRQWSVPKHNLLQMRILRWIEAVEGMLQRLEESQ